MFLFLLLVKENILNKHLDKYFEVKISSPLMTQGGQPCKQQNSAQGGPPCASYLLRRAVRPPTSKTMRRADRPVHHISYTGRSALQPAKQCAGQTALCIISTPAIQGHRVLGATNLHIYPLLHCGIKKLCLG